MPLQPGKAQHLLDPLWLFSLDLALFVWFIIIDRVKIEHATCFNAHLGNCLIGKNLVLLTSGWVSHSRWGYLKSSVADLMLIYV